jgi:hypothetical protein
VLDKANASPRRDVFMIDARRGFMKDGNKNRLRSQDMHKIVDVFVRKTEVPRYSRLVPFEEIEKNDFNLNIPRYVDSSEPEDIHDLGAHLSGGIPERDVAALGVLERVPDAGSEALRGRRLSRLPPRRRQGRGGARRGLEPPGVRAALRCRALVYTMGSYPSGNGEGRIGPVLPPT